MRSGRTLRRPGLRAALAACRSGEAEGIAVARLDRLTYSLADLAELVREAVEGGYTIVSLQPAVDIAADGGRAVGEVLAEAASWQPRAIASAGRALTGRPGRPSSTPGPVAERIRGLRAQGMTLQGSATSSTARASRRRAGAPSGAPPRCGRSCGPSGRAYLGSGPRTSILRPAAATPPCRAGRRGRQLPRCPGGRRRRVGSHVEHPASDSETMPLGHVDDGSGGTLWLRRRRKHHLALEDVEGLVVLGLDAAASPAAGRSCSTIASAPRP